MDKLFDKLEAFIEAFNVSQKLINEILEKQNASAIALAELVAAAEELDADAEGEDEEEDAGPDEAPPVYVAEPSDAVVGPTVSCFTCYAYDETAHPHCRRWQQTPPPEVKAVGCHEWVLSPTIKYGAEPEPDPAPAAAPAPAKKKPGPKPKAEPKASRGKGKANGLEAVPF